MPGSSIFGSSCSRLTEAVGRSMWCPSRSPRGRSRRQFLASWRGWRWSHAGEADTDHDSLGGMKDSAIHSNSVVVSDFETHELGHLGHGAVEKLEITEGELIGSESVRADLQRPLGPIEER
jgi:hypothetical protein